MKMYRWDTEENEYHNVSVWDGTLTYYSVWYDDDGAIDLRDVADSFADGYDHNDDPTPVSIVVTNLITGEELEDEIEPETDEDDEDEDEDDEEEAQ